MGVIAVNLTHQPQTSTGSPVINFASEPHRGARPAKSEAVALRDALPFFKKGNSQEAASWWNVTPSGDYVTDLETGKEYARAYLPMLQFNAGGADLGIIVSHMALAGRDPAKPPRPSRGIDNVALGFMMEIGGVLQSAMLSISVATVAIESPNSDLGPKFVELVKNGGAMRSLNRSTLFHDPNARVFSRPAE
jgi:hypothetical protein